ncbi:hypothetical protein [Microbacterium sp. NPDC087589]|uniref:hypothetical protein n=1 Tax=Microbacterium sp. NPDC087589 TaxID=3364191 RepID=UPI0038145CEC
MSLLHSKAGSRPQYESAKAEVVAPVRNDAFALPILIAYMVFMLPVLVLRVVAVAAFARLVRGKGQANLNPPACVKR